MRGTGVLTDSDLALAHSECEASPAADLSFARICDLSEVTGVSVSDEALEAWVADPISSPAVRHALVCSAPPVVKRVVDYIALSRKQFHQVSVFPTYDQAMDWLKRDR
jgi:hypothetical protein